MLRPRQIGMLSAPRVKNDPDANLPLKLRMPASFEDFMVENFRTCPEMLERPP